MNFFDQDHSQINESYIYQNKLDPVFYWRVLLTMLSGLPWWCQIYEYSELQFWRILTNWEFLTFWGVWSVHLYFLTSVIDMLFWMKYKNRDYVSKLWKFQHFLFHFAFSTSLAILVMFWIAYYPDLPESYTSNRWYMFNQTIQHGLLFVCIGIEFIYNNIRLDWKHLGLVFIALTVYMIVNVIITFSYQPVYDMIDWTSVMCYVYIAGVYILVILYFYFGKYIYDKYKLPKIAQQRLNLNYNSSIHVYQENRVYPKV